MKRDAAWKRALLSGGVLLAFAVLALVSCGGGRSRPNLLLIVVDTLRADHLGSYGYPRNTSPAIDRLAAEGTRFENAFTPAPWTLPAFASLLTSRLPWEHGAVNDYLAPRADIPFLPEVLRGAGYETAAFVSHIYTSRVYGFDAGFDRFEDFRIGEDYAFDQGREPRAEEVVREAIRWLAGRKNKKPFFLLVHLFDPHWAYDAPEPFRARFDPGYSGSADGSYRTIARFFSPDSIPPARDLEHIIALYDGEILYTDAWLDTLFRALDRAGAWGKTAVVVTADHGEEFRDHGSMGHSFTFFDEVLRVPLIIRRPNERSGGTVNEPVSLLDIFPTLAEWAGAEIRSGLRGRSLLRTPEKEPRFLEAGTIREGRYGRAVLRGTKKLIRDAQGDRLFDRASDPRETNDLLRGGFPFDGSEAEPLAARIDETGPLEGWQVVWSSRTERPGASFSGTIDPEGIIVELLPHAGCAIDLEATDNGSFRFAAHGSGGLRFRVVPPEGAVRFRLLVEGEERSDRVRIGREGFHPPGASFGLDPATSPEGVLRAPETTRSDEPFFLVWKELDPPTPRLITLSPAERERLRSLGYLE
ncbi:MAG: sulfatase [Candidatus Eisenbacteria bacterium]|nr:sulfatase [Candidatus Eisenbacteria bacterium]